MLRVGLTGGIGSGKSEVAGLLAQHGAAVIDADALAREVVAPGTKGFAEVVAAFGPDVVAPDGALDRAALAERVFSDAEARHQLEAVIHPRVRRRAAQLEAMAPPDSVVVHDIPLLVETAQTDRFDLVVVVDVPPELAVQRLVNQRGMAEQQARDRVSAQAGRDQRLAAADVVIDNGGDLDGLRARVDELWRELSGRVSRR
jgi:dephospho-CoA kinase